MVIPERPYSPAPAILLFSPGRPGSERYGRTGPEGKEALVAFDARTASGSMEA